MASYHDGLIPEQLALIEEAKLFFVASVHPELSEGEQGQGPVNCSPKGNLPLVVLDRNTVAYLDTHGSGNETARHAHAGGPVALMVMSLEAEDAAIVRLYGRAEVQSLEASPHASALLAGREPPKGLRQVVVVHVESTQTSCGYGVPVFEYRGERSPAQRGRRYK